jgi:hypothetical protein
MLIMLQLMTGVIGAKLIELNESVLGEKGKTKGKRKKSFLLTFFHEYILLS